MKTSTAILCSSSILLILNACSSSSNTSMVKAMPLPSNASINSVPLEYQQAVKEKKDLGLNFVTDPDFKGTVKINGELYNDTNAYKISELPNGLNKIRLELNTPTQNDIEGLDYQTDLYIYQQPYSMVLANYIISSNDPTDANHIKKLDYWGTTGLRTENIPLAGQASYTGEAFYNNQKGKLNYNVDFHAKEGSGEITGFSQFGKISLLKDQISKDVALKGDDFGAGIAGTVHFEKGLAHPHGGYQLGLFGPNAEEIAGGLWNMEGNINIIFGGKRGDITPK